MPFAHAKYSGFWNAGTLYFWSPEFGSVLVLESGILGFAIRNLAQGVWNPTNDWNISSTDKESGYQYLKYGIYGVDSRIEDCLG